MARSLTKLRIFAASPSDVVAERAKLEIVVDSLKPMAEYLGLVLEVVDWSAVMPEAGRPQQAIFNQLKPTSWDIFIGILWHRFGTPPGAKDKLGNDYLSGTEEEFKTSYELWRQNGKPRIMLYRCTRALPFDVDTDQLKRVRDFFKLVEDVKGNYPTLYQAFDTTESFEKLVLDNLQKLLIEYGEHAKTPITPEVARVFLPQKPNNLPRRQSFFGRVKEMEMVMRAISPADRTWGVLIDGIGGIGKSSIAIESAYRAQEAGLFDAFVFVTAKQSVLEPSGIKELNPPARTLDEFLNETSRVLGQPGTAKLMGNEKLNTLIDLLRLMRTLLIYDNLETLSKEEQEGITDFLRELPQGCKAIITSRRRGGEGGVWMRVEKLDWDAAQAIIENEMVRDVGLANKMNRVEKTRWQELFNGTNGSPLALIHILGLMRVRPTLTYVTALEMLRGNRDADLQKFIFREANRELTEYDKTALSALSLFVPSAIFEAWMEIAGLSRNTLETTIDRLNALSLVDILAGEERFTLHPLTRTFAREELLSDPKVLDATEARFTQYWIAYSNRYGGYSNESYSTYQMLESEWQNLEVSAKLLWQRICEREDKIDERSAFSLIQLADALWQYLRISARWDERLELNIQAFYAASKIKEWHSAGWHAYGAAWIWYSRDRLDMAQDWMDKCEQAWAKSAIVRDKGVQLWMRGCIALRLDQFEKSENLLQQSEKIWEILENPVWSSIVHNSLGDVYFKSKRFKDAEMAYSRALTLSKETSNHEGQGIGYGQLGKVFLSRKQFSEAARLFEQQKNIAENFGMIQMASQAKYSLALVYEEQGNDDLALPLAQEALKIYERLQHKDVLDVRALLKRLEDRIK